MQYANRHMAQRYQKHWPEGTLRNMQQPSELLWMIPAVLAGDINNGCYKQKEVLVPYLYRGLEAPSVKLAKRLQ
eukprot:6886840-Karenia_brevis.AAC.1